jgi:hypothetical protein
VDLARRKAGAGQRVVGLSIIAFAAGFSEARRFSAYCTVKRDGRCAVVVP